MHTEKRRRPDLKVKRRDKHLFSPPQSTINDDCIIISPEKQHYNTIPSHTMKILYSSISQKDNKIQLPKSKVLIVNLTLDQSIFTISLRKEMWYFISMCILFVTINRNGFLPKTHQSLNSDNT